MIEKLYLLINSRGLFLEKDKRSETNLEKKAETFIDKDKAEMEAKLHSDNFEVLPIKHPMEIKSPKDMEVGDTFLFTMPNPEGYLHLRIFDIEEETDIPWCIVEKHVYNEPDEDEHEESDRYKRGDKMPHIYDSECLIIKSNR